MTKIRWTDQEASIVAARFLQLRLESVENMGAFAGALLTRAMEALPEDKRRSGIPGFSAGRTFEDQLARCLAGVQALITAPPVAALDGDLVRLKEFHQTVCALIGMNPEVDVVATANELKARLAVANEVQPEELPPLVIEIAGPASVSPTPHAPQDLHTVLSSAPAGMLLGYALERMFGGLRGSLPTAPITDAPPRVDQVTASITRMTPTPAPVAPTAPAVVAAPAITSATLDAVPPPPRRVCVAGLFSGSVATLTPQVKQFANLDVNLLGPLDKTSRVTCDYAIIMRGSVPHGEAEALRKKLTAKDRVRYADTNDGVLRHLSDINSLQ